MSASKVLVFTILALALAANGQKGGGKTRPSQGSRPTKPGSPRTPPGTPRTPPGGSPRTRPNFPTRGTAGTHPPRVQYCQPACTDTQRCQFDQTQKCTRDNYTSPDCWQCVVSDLCNGKCSSAVGEFCAYSPMINADVCCPVTAASKQNPECFGCMSRTNGATKPAQCPQVHTTPNPNKTPTVPANGGLDFKGICGDLGVEDEGSCEEFCVKEENMQDSKWIPAGSPSLKKAGVKGAACCCTDDKVSEPICCSMCDPVGPSSKPATCSITQLPSSTCGQAMISLVSNSTFISGLETAVKDQSGCDFTAPVASSAFQSCFEVKDVVTAALDAIGQTPAFKGASYTTCCPIFKSCLTTNPFFKTLFANAGVAVIDQIENLDCNDDGNETC
eukprot:m.256617 g.256617  ORF g.256617 m.256617 type:complete len:388 (-) comp34521_c0_seq1:47-1210(-)